MKQILNNLPALVMATDDAGLFVFWNLECERVTGYSADEIVGNPDAFKRLYPNNGENQKQLFRGLHDGHGRGWQCTLTCKDGSERVIECSDITGDYTAAGWATLTMGFDITARNHALDALATSQLELQQTVEEYTALHRATSSLFYGKDLDELTHQIVSVIVKEFEHADCGVILLEEDHRTLKRWARAGTYDVQTQRPLFLDGDGLVPRAMRSEEMVYAPDVSSEENYIPNVPETRCELVVPLKTAHGVLGVLDFQSAVIDAFSAEDRRVIHVFAERAAAAIEIRSLYDRISVQNDELEGRVHDRTAQMERATRRIEAILNNNNDAVMLAQVDGRIEQTNPAFDNMFGYEPDDMFGKPMTSLVLPEFVESFEWFLERLVTTHESQRWDIVALRQDGSHFDAEVVLSYIDNPDEPGIVCSLRDVTERKQAEEALKSALAQQRQLNEMKSQFVSMASHDFRTPLTSVLSSADLLSTYWERQLPGEKPERVQHHFERIRDAIRRMVNLLDDFMLINKADAGRMTISPVNVDMNDLGQEVIETAKSIATDNHELVLNTNGACMDAVVDETLIRRLLDNLLSNAVKYSPEGGIVALNLSCTDETLMIEVQDEGIGIPDDDQRNLFTTFFRAKNVTTIAGTGLGLAIVKSCVDAHQGTIALLSREGGGTTFTVRLPRKPPAPGRLLGTT